ncbi:hypothetical protein [Trichlorobacter lovleyi]|uniref:hypothetical protein n=1 Tax=Trichlorobacter lovleyi TaxID=313985 RepID=UPI003D105D1B
MEIIKCKYCGKPRPDHVKTCPYCNPSAAEILKHDLGKVTGVASSVAKSYRDSKTRQAVAEIQRSTRKCLSCGYVGQMKTYLSDSWSGIIIAVVLFCFWIVPGLIFVAVNWGKRKCPNCGAIGKNTAVSNYEEEGTRICPHCAETIKAAARICRYCQKEVTPI